MEDDIFNISPIDGRYKDQTEEVANHFSEYHLIRNRVIVEIEWLKKLLHMDEIKENATDEEVQALDKIVNAFDINQAKRVKEIESITKHDVKAVEYYLDEKLEEFGMKKYKHLVHFVCTSEDINNLAYGVMINELLENVYEQNVNKLIQILKEKSKEYAAISMLSHTHGQNATPTTVGKELAIFANRMKKFLERIKQEKLSGKFNRSSWKFQCSCYSLSKYRMAKSSKGIR